MGFSMKHFTHDEVLVLDLHPHWWRFVKPVVLIIATLAALANTHHIQYEFLRNLALIITQVLSVLAVLNLALQTLKWYRTHFVLTSQRVIFQSGVIGRTRIDIALHKINVVNFHQNIFQRLINAGDIIIEAGTDDGVETIIGVRDPQNVQAYIHEWMRRNIDEVNN
jgi:uncharacterized membrane protein YdbT with pleckstrin-like domain